MTERVLDLKPPRYPNGLSPQTLRRVHEYIQAHLGERITLADLAQVAGVSRFHFCRRFRRSTAESPMCYLQRCRLEYAKQLLAHCDLTIAEIAAIAGFCDQSHLSRWFRKFMGMTPREFARENNTDGGKETNRALASIDASAPNAGMSTSVAPGDLHRLLVALDHRAIVRRNLRV